MRKQLLVGANKEKELVFANLGIRTWNGCLEFSASFDTVRPFNTEEIDLEERAKSRLECLDKATLYDLCEHYNCSPSNLSEEYIEDAGIDNLIDLSLYSNYIYVNGAEWRFETCGCGQQDTRSDMKIYVNKELYDYIIYLWDNYHLKKINEVIQKEVEKIIIQLEEIDEKQWIKDYIENYIN